MDRLRSPGGCPWDAAQTHRSLVEYLVEETYETVEAIEADDRAGLREELGDLLLQVVFHSRIAEEDPVDPWSIDEVAADIADKLVSRHPHVFGDARAHTPEQVESTWQAAKAVEKGRTSVTDGVPLGLPGPVLAAKLMSRAGRGGLAAVPVVEDRTPADGLLAAMDSPDRLGDLLLDLVRAARERGWDADAALRAATRRYRERLRAAEDPDSRSAPDPV